MSRELRRLAWQGLQIGVGFATLFFAVVLGAAGVPVIVSGPLLLVSIGLVVQPAIGGSRWSA